MQIFGRRDTVEKCEVLVGALQGLRWGRSRMSHVDPLPSLQEPARVRANTSEVSKWLDAAKGGLLPQLKSMLASDGNLIRASDTFGTALHWAASRDQRVALPFLLQAGVRIDATNSAGQTALHVAAHCGSLDCTSILLDKGANVAARSRAGMSPLHHATAASHVRIAQRLLEAGATLDPYDPSRPKITSPTALAARISASASGVERQRESRSMLQLLEQEQKRLGNWLRAVRAMSEQLMRELLDATPRAVHPDVCVGAHGSGTTALMKAASAARPDVLELLLERGANVRRADHNGMTALHHLANAAGERHGVDRLVPALLQAGARADARDAQGRTPADIAAVRGGRRGAHSNLHESLLRALAQQFRMRRWRIVGLVAGRLHTWHARAAERAYAPSGGGYVEAALDWQARVGGKRPRPEEGGGPGYEPR